MAVETLSRWTRARISLVCGVLVLLFVGVVSRAHTLQAVEGEKLKEMAEQQYLRQIKIPSRRGSIVDRHGTPLAVSVEVDSIFANPRVVGSRAAEVAMKLEEVLGLDRQRLKTKLSSRRYFTWIKRRVSPRESAAVKGLKIRGVQITQEPRRFYPNKGLGGSVVGFSGIDGRGLEGVELSLDAWLKGSPARVSGLRDALGRSLITESTGSVPTAGHDVHLTLDKFIQFETEQALAEAAEEVRPKSGWAAAAVLDPKTGDVLAMASAPTYDPNRYGKFKSRERRNRVITDAFEPGSTLKIFSVGAALDLGLVRPREVFNCEKGAWRVGHYTIHDSHPYTWLDVAGILKKSSNICSAKIGFRLGKTRLVQRLERYGFGRPTGVSLRGERAGVLRSPSRLSDVGLANVAFGQGLTTTVLQLAQALTAVGNDGVMMKPRLVTRVSDQGGNTVHEFASEGKRVMRTDTARRLLKMLVGVTEPGGTGVDAALSRYTVAGKTGTAQKVDPVTRTYATDLWVSSFIGLVPASAPRLAIAVVVNEPAGEKHYGGEVAGPVFKRIAEKALRYLGVKPDRRPSSRGETQRRRPSPGAEPAVSDAAEGYVVLEENPAPPLPGNGGRTGSLLVPDFTGLSIAEVLAVAHKRGFEVQAEGSGRAVAQSPGPGPAPVGTVCRVAFRPPR